MSFFSDERNNTDSSSNTSADTSADKAADTSAQTNSDKAFGVTSDLPVSSFPQNETESERLARLREKANGLPLSPGVYIMKDKNGRIVYVGKSRVLRQRVSQYFAEAQNHTVKTRRMVASVRTFEYILTKTEIEALTLENQLIKLHMPHYNIKLKDGRGYPYIRVTLNEDYPRMSVVHRRANDGAKYFGPYSGTGVAYTILNTARKCFGVASCNRVFPRDIGKARPCLNKQIGQCCAPCTGDISRDEYRAVFRDIVTFLRGHFSDVRRSLTEQMEYASDNLMFESAALFRDRIEAIKRLWDQQIAVGAPQSEYDVFALAHDDDKLCSCLTVLYVRDGFISDTDHFIFTADVITDAECIISCIYDMYSAREYIPHEILFDFDPQKLSGRAEKENGGGTSETAEKETADNYSRDGSGSDGRSAGGNGGGSANDGRSAGGDGGGSANDGRSNGGNGGVNAKAGDGGDDEGSVSALENYLTHLRLQSGENGAVRIKIPVRGDLKSLCGIAGKNAAQHLTQYKADTEKRGGALIKLASMLGLEVVPEHIEAFDISNYGNENITAGMVVLRDGKFSKSEYRTYNIAGVSGQDDYASMREAITRRVSHATEGTLPDLILLDGGRGHVSTVKDALYEIGADIPVFGMVKDDFHKTRALTTESEEINIAREQAVFMMIYGLQEEVHRFTVSRMSGAKSKTLRKSSLEKISGIGPAKSRALLAHFKSLAALKNAPREQILEVKGISASDADKIFAYFSAPGENTGEGKK